MTADDSSEWIEVKPRKHVPKVVDAEPGSPRTPRARTQSFGMDTEVSMKSRIGKHARKINKLEWSASKLREREMRVNKREKQREAAARERDEKSAQ